MGEVIPAPTGETVAGPLLPRPSSRVRWRWLLLGGLVLVAAGVAAFHALGPALGAGVLVAGAVVILAALVLRYLPHLRKHFFGGPRMRSRTRSTRSSVRSSRSASPRRKLLGGGSGSRGSLFGRKRSRAATGAATGKRRRFGLPGGSPRAAGGRRPAGAKSPAQGRKGGPLRGLRLGRGRAGGRTGGRPAGGTRARKGPAGGHRLRLPGTRGGVARRGNRGPHWVRRLVRRSPRPGHPPSRKNPVRGQPRPQNSPARGQGRQPRLRVARARVWRVVRGLPGWPVAGVMVLARAVRRPFFRRRRKGTATQIVTPTTAGPQQSPLGPVPPVRFQPPAPQPGPALDPGDALARKDPQQAEAGGRSMQHQHTDGLAEAFHDHVAKFEPEHMAELDRYLFDLPEVFAGAGTDFGLLAERLAGDNPVDQAVAEKLREAAASFAGLGEMFREVYQQWRQAHEDDLKRLESPRVGEEKWDKANAPT